MKIILSILLASLAVILTGLTWLAITEPCDPTSNTIWCGSELTRKAR